MNGKTCTFFGHRDCPASIRRALRATLIRLIEQEGVTSFLMGCQGAFDAAAASVLRELWPRYPQINCAVVLAYLPRRAEAFPLPTLLPEGIERVPGRFAISWRNRWMLEHCDMVVCYVTHSWGGAAKFVQLAKKRGKSVCNLAEADGDVLEIRR